MIPMCLVITGSVIEIVVYCKKIQYMETCNILLDDWFVFRI